MILVVVKDLLVQAGHPGEDDDVPLNTAGQILQQLVQLPVRSSVVDDFVEGGVSR